MKYRNYTLAKMPITPPLKEEDVVDFVQGVAQVIIHNWVDGKGLQEEQVSGIQDWIFQFYNISGNFPNLEDVNHQIDIMKNFH